jgi:transcriptional regulator with XRE-family HTH domain
MSMVGFGDLGIGGEGSDETARVPLHRLGEVRRMQRVSRRALANRLSVSESEIRRQEDATTDLPLSVLHDWQRALGVPIAELLVESEDEVSQPIIQRAYLVRLMKTALALLEQAEKAPVKRMAQTLVDQLIEVMPELRGVTAWNAVGRRRGLDELGMTALRMISEDVFLNCQYP